MAKDKRLANSNETLLFEGLGMAALGAVALCYPGPELETILIPVGILLLLNGVARLLFSIWLFDHGSTWRQLLRQSAWVDIFIGIAGFTFVGLEIQATIELIAIWMVVSGYFHIRRFFCLRVAWPGTSLLGIIGLLSIVVGGLLLGNSIWMWLPYIYDFSAAAIFLGIGKIYAFIKPGRRSRRLSEDSERTAEKRAETSLAFIAAKSQLTDHATGQRRARPRFTGTD